MHEIMLACSLTRLTLKKRIPMCAVCRYLPGEDLKPAICTFKSGLDPDRDPDAQAKYLRCNTDIAKQILLVSLVSCCFSPASFGLPASA